MAVLDFGIEPEMFWNMTEREFFTLVIYDLRRKENDMLRMRAVVTNAMYNMNRGKKPFKEFPFENRQSQLKVIKQSADKDKLFAQFGGQVSL
ncbi:hypothetical protein [Bacillus wiedmannii]|uniref:hypothetical protein n=1 Tax=Bacillus wiedmannii TaxID=1890302 RepID=UPI000BF4BB4C|nr:hypothetical protein [Bacillus wiedmannii]PEP21518.1 hypothetical protein CN580_21340 [Bacillus wiedmannii]